MSLDRAHPHHHAAHPTADEAGTVPGRATRIEHARSDGHAGAPVASAASTHGGQGGYARRDQYNRGQHRGRPHVSVGKRETFTVTQDAQRYTIVGANGTRPFDTIEAGTEVTVNISAPRRLALEGGRHDCVFVRTVKGGSAWLRSDRLTGNTSKLEHAAHAAADRYAPSAPKGTLRPRVFKTRPQHSNLALTPDHAHQSKAKLEHYLERETAQVAGFYNICLNLPQPGTPPVQVDVARPGDHFFVMQTREVAGYVIGGSAKPRRITWAFGCVGLQDATGAWKPDHSRRGWVPVATLA